jgi:hypothetical protein
MWYCSGRLGPAILVVDFRFESALLLHLLFSKSGGFLPSLQVFEFALAVQLVHVSLLPTCNFIPSTIGLRARSISRAILGVGRAVLSVFIGPFGGGSIYLWSKSALLYSSLLTLFVALFLASFVFVLAVRVQFLVDLLFNPGGYYLFECGSQVSFRHEEGSLDVAVTF